VEIHPFFTFGLTHNYLQVPGAIVADILLQGVGYGILVLLLALFFWGERLLRVKPVSHFPWRLVSLVLSILFCSQCLSLVKNQGVFLVSSTYGGALGQLSLFHTMAFFKHLFGRQGEVIAIVLPFILFGMTLVYATGFQYRQWLRGIQEIRTNRQDLSTFIQKIGGALLFLFSKIGRWVSSKKSMLRFDRRAHGNKAYPIHSKNDSNAVSEEGGQQKKIIKTADLHSLIKKPELDLGVDEEDLSDLDNVLNEPLNGHLFQDQQGNHEDVSFDTFLKQLSESQPSSDQQTPLDKKKKSGGLFSSFIPSASKERAFALEEYQLPSVDLLDPPAPKNKKFLSESQLEECAQQLEQVLQEFGVRGEIMGICPGPVVTLYEFRPAAGIKTSRVIGLADDIARSMSAHSARIAVIPGRNVIGIELPNPIRETVYLRDLLETDDYVHHSAPLAMILGKDIGGNHIIADLAKMPHLLVAGTTGSGKSVSINTMILSILFRQSPDKCKFILIDPKMLEFSAYDGIPHLLTPVVTEPKKAVIALKWAVREMENRYRAMSKLGVRNIDGYNARLEEARTTGELLMRRIQTGFDPDTGKPIFENQSLDATPLPYIVIVVDEMADLMLVAGKEIELTVQRLAQMARAAGIHLIMATQRPSVDVITGTIKANFPTRISFMVTSKIDSRTILGEQGAEQLLGQGDMLYMMGGGRVIRVHGPFIKDMEVERIVQFLKSQREPSYIDSVTEDDSESSAGGSESQGGDDLYCQAVEIVRREGKASTSFVQRHLQIGYNRAARIIERMEKEGIVSPANHAGKREVVGG
jgi:S-DNA-T family DNA segregation ATPase FtsK/SpoIIIE